jgi:hypothetical protein
MVDSGSKDGDWTPLQQTADSDLDVHFRARFQENRLIEQPGDRELETESFHFDERGLNLDALARSKPAVRCPPTQNPPACLLNQIPYPGQSAGNESDRGIAPGHP